MRYVSRFFACCALTLVGCATGTQVDSSGEAQVDSGADADGGKDVSLDSPSDSSNGDSAAPDTGGNPDSSNDTSIVDSSANNDNDVVDSQFDSPVDTQIDSESVDSQADSQADSSFDAPVDAQSDSMPDSKADAGCVMPQEACYAGGDNGENCATAMILPRQSTTLVMNGKLSASDGDDNTPSCAQSGADRYYRIYLLAGEKLDVVYKDLVNGFDGVLVIRQSTQGCNSTTCDQEVACQNAYHEAGMNEHIIYVAPENGWYSIVADSRITPTVSGYNNYELDVTLYCTGTCGC
jgi:hypothetical protein